MVHSVGRYLLLSAAPPGATCPVAAPVKRNLFPFASCCAAASYKSQEKSFPSAANIAWAECSHRKALCRNDLASESAKVTFVKGKCYRFRGIEAVNDCLATV